MKIVGFNFSEIRAEKKSQSSPSEKLKITSNITVDSITQEKIDMIKDQIPLKFSFNFSIGYNPNLAEISLKGFIIVLFDKTKAKEIQKKFKTKKIEDDTRIPLFNFILTKSSLKALQLEEELGLPYHMPFPRITPQESQESNRKTNYTG